MPALLLLTGPSAGLRYDVVTEATLGRSPSCEIPLEDNKVSRRHAKIELKDGQTRISDLGSRNGTVVNGEKIESEAILLPGDRVQVGETTVLFEPPARASLSDRAADGESAQVVLEEIVASVGPEAALHSAGIALLSATSEAMVLRRAAEEAGRGLNAEKSAALLGDAEGLLTAAVVGASSVEVPRAMARAALERREVGRAGGTLVVPLTASGGSPFGILYLERPEPFTAADQRLAASLGRLSGEAFAAVRSREGQRGEVALVGPSRQFRKTVEQARRAAASTDPVVLHGESGSGREQIARYIHTRSARAVGPWVVVDCRQAPVSVDEELFGRPSGPGTPPLSSALLRADGGTLVLKSVEGLARSTAERLARHLSKKTAPARQGGEEPVDVRVIATVSQPLKLLAAKGDAEPELARALSGLEIEALPMRERKADVLALFEYFAGRVVRPTRRELPVLSQEAKRMLTDYSWPMNVRELKGVAERLAMLYPGQEVTSLRLPPEVQEGGVQKGPKSLADMIAKLEKDAIQEALREARGKKIKAAALLGISRPTLDKKIEDYQLVVEKIRRS